MNKFIKVTDSKGIIYTFNVAHIVCVKEDAHGAIIYHTEIGHSSYVTVREDYNTIMGLINQ